MNKQQFIEKYGHIKVRFSSYFKADFSFVVDLGSEYIFVHVGGSLDDIYEVEVSANSEYLIKDMDPWFGYVQKNNGEIYDSFSS